MGGQRVGGVVGAVEVAMHGLFLGLVGFGHAGPFVHIGQVSRVRADAHEQALGQRLVD
jgi:hypothetical protein